MKNACTKLCRRLLTLVLLVTFVIGLGVGPALALTGSVSAAATPSNSTPAIGTQITVTVNIDVSGVSEPDNKLGTYAGTLTWDPAVLSYSSHAGMPSGFTGMVNTDDVASGSIMFTGMNSSGATGNTVVLTVTFDVVGAGTSTLDLSFWAILSASSYVDLLTGATVTDGQVTAGGTQYTLSVTKAGTGTGTVTSTPAGIDCGATCSANFGEGQEVTLTASAAAGSKFMGWSGSGCSGTGTCVVTMDAAKSVQATFDVLPPEGAATSSAVPSDATPSVGDQIEVVINIDVTDMATPNNKLGSYTGTLTWDPAILDYVSYSGAPPTGFTGSVNTANVDAGQIAFNGANASGATGDTVVLRITFDAVAVGVSDLNLEYSAMAAANTFESLLPFLTVNDSQVDVSPWGYTLSVTKAGAGTGTVTSEPAGINCGATCSAEFAENAEVTLTAVASGDSVFAGWNGAGCSGTGTCVVTMNEAKSVEATFNLITALHYVPVVFR